jgi:WD40 repeat protein
VLPIESTAQTPADLKYVIDLKMGTFMPDDDCGPYTVMGVPANGGGAYVTRSIQFVEIDLIDATTSEVIDQDYVKGSDVQCPFEIAGGTTSLTGDPVPAQTIQAAILRLISPSSRAKIVHSKDLACDEVFSMAFTSDGKSLAVGCASAVKLWDVATGHPLRTFIVTDPPFGVGNVIFSPDGKLLAVGTGTTVQLWDVDKGILVNTLTVDSLAGGVNDFAFSPDGKRLAVEGNFSLGLWDVDTGRLRNIVKGDFGSGVTFSPDGKLFASPSNSVVKLWDGATGSPVRTLTDTEDDGSVNSLAFSPDGKSLAWGSSRNKVTLWDVETGHLQNTITLDIVAFSLLHVNFLADGRWLASGGWSDNTVRWWDVGTGTLLRTLDPLDISDRVAFSPDGKWLATAQWDGTTVKLWQVTLP